MGAATRIVRRLLSPVGRRSFFRCAEIGTRRVLRAFNKRLLNVVCISAPLGNERGFSCPELASNAPVGFMGRAAAAPPGKW
jgi:hypothetical protein